jgi:acyl-coenzyme A synthetase/AMP-(fatty) acid ligase
VEIYGASETGGIGWREDTGGAFTLLDLWSTITGQTTEGELQLAGADGRVAYTPDVVEMVSPRSFRVVRRLDAAVQVGGINVYPARVAAVLEAHPAIAKARVRLAPERAPEGARLKALLVPRDPAADTTVLRGSVQQWIDRSLAPLERPRSLRFVAALPIGPLGKPTDWSEDTVSEPRLAEASLSEIRWRDGAAGDAARALTCP